eukprot:jgi/Ulvmu1/2455/UM136_0007.1
MPLRSRQREAPAASQIFGISVSYYIGAVATLICIVLVVLKLPNRNAPFQVSFGVDQVVAINGERKGDAASLLADAPANDDYPHDGGDETQDVAPEEVTPVTEQEDTPLFESHLDCWTQNRSRMAGAPPCSSPDAGPTEGNAKVAIMFLVKSVIPTESIWTAFIASAAELKLRRPVPHTRPHPPTLLPEVTHSEADMSEQCWRHGGPMTNFGVPPRQEFQGKVPPAVANVTAWIQESCRTPLTGAQLYARQDLFSFYVHRSIGVPSAPAGSVFAGRDIKNRIKAEFAQPSLISAFKNLLEVALEDRRNSMFLLVSETCVPLHHPALLWTQLIAESHVARVADGYYSGVRWSELMATEHMKRDHFQKGAQWHSLTRMHAELVVADRHVWPQFQRYCITQKACAQPRPKFGHVCVADEHFVPTLFAVYGMDESRDRMGELTYTDWLSEQGSWHPTTFHPGNAQASTLTMRQRTQYSDCPALPVEALRSAGRLFEHTPVCHASGDYVSMLSGPAFDNRPSIQSFSRRLSAMQRDSYWPVDAAAAAGGLRDIPEAGDYVPLEDASYRDDWAGAVNRTAGSMPGWIEDDYDDADYLADAEEEEDDDAYWREHHGESTGGVGVEVGGGGLGGVSRALRLKRYKSRASAQRQKAKQDAQRQAQKQAAQMQDLAMLHRKTVRAEAASQRIPEFGYARDRQYVDKSAAIHKAMDANLRETGWLGDFVPMQMHCPLLGRRVSWQAASEFAAIAWRCDGLGFSWECLYQGFEPEQPPS